MQQGVQQHDPWPFEAQSGRDSTMGLPGVLGTCRQSTSAISAMPMGAPGCPEFAAWTASMESARIALAMARRLGVLAGVSIKGAHCPTGGGSRQPKRRYGSIPAPLQCPFGCLADNSGRHDSAVAIRGPGMAKTAIHHARSANTTHLSDSSGVETRTTLRMANPASLNSRSRSWRETRSSGERPNPSLPKVCVST